MAASPAFAQDSKDGLLDRVEANVIVDARAAVETGDPDFQSGEIRLQTELGVRLWKGAALKTITRFRADGWDKLEAGVPSQAAISRLSRRAIIGDRSDLELREFYLKSDLGRGHLTLGKQQIVWGQADGLKVLDVVNPQDFREFILEDFGDSRIPLWSVNAEIPVRNVTAQFIWLPDQSYHKLPEPGSAFVFTAPGFAILAPPGVDLIVRDAERPKFKLGNGDVGTRVSTLLGGWDLTANYFYHYDDLPAPFSEITFSETTPILEGPTLTVTPRYRRTHLLGGTFSNAFGSVVLRGEAAYFFNRPLISREIVDGKSFLARDQFRHVIGLDWFRFSETLVSFQLFQDWVPKHVPSLFVDRVATSFSVLLRRDFLNQTVTPEVLLVQNTTCGSGMVRPRISFAVNDHTKLRLGADLFHGNEGCDFGQFAQRDRVVMGVTWAF
jgi:hypothetical protein